MKIHYNLEQANFNKTVVTVGTFDGFHLGHRIIVDELIRQGKKMKSETVVLTFSSHPRNVLSGSGKKLKLLMSLDEKISAFSKAGIDHLVVYTFSKEFASLTSCEFIEQILYKKLSAKKLVVGYDHRFGKDRQGDITELNACTASFGFSVIQANVLSVEGLNVSSTEIRTALRVGDFQKANKYLGVPYSLSGKVTKGNQIGRSIDFPTANISVSEEKLLPMFGVYAVSVEIENEQYQGMLNIGFRPTVTNDSSITVEVNIFDYDSDLYEKYIKVNFYEYIRNEKEFENVDELKKQLQKDKEVVRQLFFRH